MSKDIEYMSFSSCQNFDRCPLLYYYNKIMRIKLKNEYQNIALKKGQFFAKIIESQKNVKKEAEKIFLDREIIHAKICNIVYVCMCELELLPEGGVYESTWIKKLESDLDINLKGKLDVLYEDSFVELKYTMKLEFYLNEWLAHKQLLWYFYLTPDEIEKAYMCPVRVPALRQGKEESTKGFLDRIKMDIMKRPSHYFPGYKPDRKGVKWGRVFYRNEFKGEFKDFERKMRWMREEIERCVVNDYWNQNTNGCLFPGPCDYLPICSTGGYINEEMYEKWEPR